LRDFLYLQDNRLTQLPDLLSRLQRLRNLNISENAFEVFPRRCCSNCRLAKPPVVLLIVHLALLTPAVKLPLLAAYAVTVTSAIAAKLINP